MWGVRGDGGRSGGCPIHDKISRIWLARGNNAKTALEAKLLPTDRPTDQPTLCLIETHVNKKPQYSIYSSLYAGRMSASSISILGLETFFSGNIHRR